MVETVTLLVDEDGREYEAVCEKSFVPVYCASVGLLPHSEDLETNSRTIRCVKVVEPVKKKKK